MKFLCIILFSPTVVLIAVSITDFVDTYVLLSHLTEKIFKKLFYIISFSIFHSLLHPLISL